MGLLGLQGWGLSEPTVQGQKWLALVQMCARWAQLKKAKERVGKTKQKRKKKRKRKRVKHEVGKVK